MLILIAFDSCRAHVYFDVKISNFDDAPLNMVMIKHVSDDPTRTRKYWLILSQSFHKLQNMHNFYQEFIFVTIERINMQISTFYHVCHQKRKFDVILMYNTWFHVIIFSAFRNLKNTSRKTHHSRTVYQNNIKVSFPITKMTKCWNLHVDTFNNNKYQLIVKVIHD